MFPDCAFPADPYPGTVPPFSFVHLDGHSHPLTFDVCWRIAGAELDLWLAGHGAPPLAARVPLLSYGSNRNPSKITWLRRALGLTGPVVVLRARTEGLAAVWASGFRARDGQRTSVLGDAPGASEQHAVWMATADQVAVLDRCEGRGDRYRLARLGTGAVSIDLGATDLDDHIERALERGLRDVVDPRFAVVFVHPNGPHAGTSSSSPRSTRPTLRSANRDGRLMLRHIDHPVQPRGSGVNEPWSAAHAYVQQAIRGPPSGMAATRIRRYSGPS